VVLGIKWHQFVCNNEVRRITKQPNLTVIIQSRRLSLFGRIAHMDDYTDAKMMLMAPHLSTGRKQQGALASRG